MPTSSIIEDIRVIIPMVLVEYVKAMDRHANEELRPRTDKEKSSLCQDVNKMDAFMKKALAKKGVEL
jgi:hypothetical protein